MKKDLISQDCHTLKNDGKTPYPGHFCGIF